MLVSLYHQHNVAISNPRVCGRSAVNMVNKTGPSTEPWGTPASMSQKPDVQLDFYLEYSLITLLK